VAVNLTGAQRRTSVTGVQAPAADEQTIRPDAELLFVAGAGWTKPQADGKAHVGEAEKLILGFLKATKASLGGSKSLVDLGGEGQEVLRFMTHLNQIGQTGATRGIPRAYPPAAMARSRTRWAGASSPSAAPSTATPTAAGPGARPTSSTSPTPSR